MLHSLSVTPFIVLFFSLHRPLRPRPVDACAATRKPQKPPRARCVAASFLRTQSRSVNVLSFLLSILNARNASARLIFVTSYLLLSSADARFLLRRRVSLRRRTRSSYCLFSTPGLLTPSSLESLVRLFIVLREGEIVESFRVCSWR